MRRIAIVALAFFVVLGAGLGMSANAQEVPKSLSQGGDDATLKQQKNTWTVGIVGGLLSGTYMRFVDEMAKVVDDGNEMRVLPIVSHGAASNVDDLLYVKGVDAAITQSDVFEYFRTVRKTPNLENRINYVVRLPLSEVHILAKRDIRSLEDLRGKKVSLGPEGAGSSLTGGIIFQRLGINIDAVYLNAPVSLQKVRSGEIAAMVRVIGKPIGFFSQIPNDAGLHLVPVPFSKAFADYYSLGEFTHKEYPTLVPENGRTDTLAVPAVLAVYNWKKDGDRYRRVERFVERLFQNWGKLQKAPYHPKWRDVNLAATVPGWQRFSVAEAEVAKIKTAESPDPEKLGGEFRAFLSQSAKGANPRTPEEREALFRAFMKWREQQKASPTLSAATATSGAAPTEDEIEACAKRYRSYDRSTQTYFTNQGKRRPCP
jgi:TRAP-type uncharacterized transport system substrate-binding protein